MSTLDPHFDNAAYQERYDAIQNRFRQYGGFGSTMFALKTRAIASYQKAIPSVPLLDTFFDLAAGQMPRQRIQSPILFETPARVTAYRFIAPNVPRWLYAWEEIDIGAPTDPTPFTPVVRDGGLSSDLDTQPAINMYELYNASFTAGANDDGIPVGTSPYSDTSFTLNPIGGWEGGVAPGSFSGDGVPNVKGVVGLQFIEAADGSQQPIFWKPNVHWGACS